jgi:hypothetical protein
MKRKKLSLDKLVLGSLSEAEQSNVIGGDLGVGELAITQKSTTILATCPVTLPPTVGTTITCPVPTIKS